MVLAGNTPVTSAAVHLAPPPRQGHCAVMQFAAIVQLVVIVLLAALSAMLLFVGAFGSGAVLASGATVWFWRLYRAHT